MNSGHSLHLDHHRHLYKQIEPQSSWNGLAAIFQADLALGLDPKFLRAQFNN
jgi:hypothetical protein